MQDQSPILSLPLIQPSQAQKHVTHNEALRILDALVQLTVQDRDRTSPPGDPAPGDRHIVATGATGAWAGADMRIAIWEEVNWSFLDPLPGWHAEVLSEQRMVVFDGAAWAIRRPELDNLPGLGVNTAADEVNRLAVSSPATLLNHDGAGHQLKVNKAGVADTASLLFQTGFSGRAEMGTAGNDDWSIKVSPDGATWAEALRVAAATGLVTGDAVQSSPSDATAGRLLAVGAAGAALGEDVYHRTSILGTVSQSGGVPDGALIERGGNANGTYLRFADGTQFCTAQVVLTFNSSTNCNAVWTYPAAFAAAPETAASVNNLSAAPAPPDLGATRTFGGGATSVTIFQYRVTGRTNFVSGDTVTVSAIAFGRWF